MRLSDERTYAAAPAPRPCSIESHMLAAGASAAATSATPFRLAATCSNPANMASVPALVDVMWSDESTWFGMPTLTMTVPERSFSTYGGVVEANANRVTLSGATGADSG